MVDPTFTSFLTIIGSGCAAYFGAYLKKRGEDQAMKEGFAEVLRQAAETTRTTKAIEARISDDVWDRQKRWELRRELFLDAVKKVGELDDALTSLHALYMTEKLVTAGGKSPNMERRFEAGRTFGDAANNLDLAISLVRLVATAETIESLHSFILMSRRLYQVTVTGNPEAFTQSVEEYIGRQKTITMEIRKELGID